MQPAESSLAPGTTTSRTESTPRFTGTFTALVTPFDIDHRYLQDYGPDRVYTSANTVVDYGALERTIENQIRHGVGLVLLGTTGESPTVTAAERTEMIRRVVLRVRGRVLVIVGTGTNDTQETMDQTCAAADGGADAALVVVPYYNKPTQTGLRRHYDAVADASPIPVILYDVPKRTGVAMSTETILGLSQHPNIVGVKWASGDMQQVQETADRAQPAFAVLSGDDDKTVEAIGHGARGVISVLSNLLPGEVHRMVEVAMDGRMEDARALHQQLESLMRGCFLQTNPLPVKTALAVRGDIREILRLPLCAMDAQFRDQWIATLRNAGVIPSSSSPS